MNILEIYMNTHKNETRYQSGFQFLVGKTGLASLILPPSLLPKKPRPDFVGTVLFSRPLWKASFPRSRKNKTRSYRCGLLVRREDRIRTF